MYLKNNSTTPFLFFIFAILLLVNCSSPKSIYGPGLEGMETVYEPKQFVAVGDLYGSNGGFNGSVVYSPINRIGLLYDTKINFFKQQTHTAAIGIYFKDYEKVDFITKEGKTQTLDIGRHIDLYTGASYCYTNDATISVNTFFTFPSVANDFMARWEGKRYFVNLGGHVKSKHVGFDLIFRQLWLETNKLSIIGLRPEFGLDPYGDFANNNIKRYNELAFKINFGGLSKPFFMGFCTLWGQHTAFTGFAFSNAYIFIGANQNIVQLFQKK